MEGLKQTVHDQFNLTVSLGKGLSKNKHTSENAVARSRSWSPVALQ